MLRCARGVEGGMANHASCAPVCQSGWFPETTLIVEIDTATPFASCTAAMRRGKCTTQANGGITYVMAGNAGAGFTNNVRRTHAAHACTPAQLADTVCIAHPTPH